MTTLAYKHLALTIDRSTQRVTLRSRAKTVLSLTYTQLGYLAALLALVTLFAVMPSTVKLLLVSALFAAVSYYGYRVVYQPDKRRSVTHSKNVFPSVYELPGGGGGNTSIGWTIDPEEQERINKTIGLTTTTASAIDTVTLSEEGSDSDELTESVNVLVNPEEEYKDEGFAPSVICYNTQPSDMPVLPATGPGAGSARKTITSGNKGTIDIKKVQQYQQLYDELLKTEQSYINALQTCSSVYILPLQKAINSREVKLTAQDCSVLFSNIDAILRFHLMLLSDLKKSPSSSIGDVFIKFSDWLKMYTSYVSNYSASIELMNKLTTDNKSMIAFLARQRSSSDNSNGLDLMSYLIQPIQRIPRYEMLLQGLLKNATDKKLQSSLTLALNKIHSIAMMVNERKREIENASLILELQSRIKNRSTGTSLLAPHRKLMRYGDVVRVKRDKKQKVSKKSNLVALLLTDLLILVKSDSYEYKLEVDAASIVSVDHSIIEEKTLFVQYRDGKDSAKLELEFKGVGERESWLSSLRQCCENGRK